MVSFGLDAVLLPVYRFGQREAEFEDMLRNLQWIFLSLLCFFLLGGACKCLFSYSTLRESVFSFEYKNCYTSAL